MATLNILYEDPHILVCVKPHGIATQSKSIRYPDMVSLIKTIWRNPVVPGTPAQLSLPCRHPQTGPTGRRNPCLC